VLVACALAVGPGVATATADDAPLYDDPPYGWPVPSTPTLQKSLDVAYRYWAARHVTVAPRAALDVRLAHLGPVIVALAEVGGERVWFDDLYYARAIKPRRDVWWRTAIRRDFCDTTVHEVGHTAGLLDGDPRYGMMDGAWAPTPYGCRLAFRSPRPPADPRLRLTEHAVGPVRRSAVAQVDLGLGVVQRASRESTSGAALQVQRGSRGAMMRYALSPSPRRSRSSDSTGSSPVSSRTRSSRYATVCRWA
jgi:hypothetical protein